jgi:hypothetical protein
LNLSATLILGRLHFAPCGGFLQGVQCWLFSEQKRGGIILCKRVIMGLFVK